jgi:Kef-type K+ transport system membrane component KefB
MAFLLAADAHGVAIPLSMLIVFGCAKLLAEVFERFGQPGIVGEIIAGVLVGPSVFGWIQPNDILSALAELGVMFLLFRVGLEVKSSELMKVGATASVVAILGVIVPFFLGWGIMRAWGYPQIESVFMGAAMVATSVGITAQVLNAKGLLHLLSAKIILGAAVIDDILGLIVLAIVSSAAKGAINFIEIGFTAALAIGFTIVIAKWGTPAMARLIPRAQANLKAGETQFNVALILLFGLSVLAIYAGVAAIIGAFLAGMALAESVNDRVHDLAHGITELLVPFFLAGIGLRLDLAAFGDPSMVALALVIFAAAVISKMAGCGLGALRLGRSDMFRIGCGMVPRGEVGMVVAQIGLTMGVVEKPVYGVAVFMAVATTIVAPPLLKIAYRSERPGRTDEEFAIG